MTRLPAGASGPATRQMVSSMRTVPEPSMIGFSSVNSRPTKASPRRLRNGWSPGLSMPRAKRRHSGIEASANTANATSWYCQYNPGECNQFNFSTGACVLEAGQRTPPESWITYACFNNFIPTGAVVNGTVPPGPVVGQGNSTAGIVPAAVGGALSSLFGVSIEAILAMISLFASIGIGGAIAIKIRSDHSGIFGVISFIGSLFAFSFIRWLPVWVPLSIMIISIFIASMWGRKMFTGN